MCLLGRRPEPRVGWGVLSPGWAGGGLSPGWAGGPEPRVGRGARPSGLWPLEEVGLPEESSLATSRSFLLPALGSCCTCPVGPPRWYHHSQVVGPRVPPGLADWAGGATRGPASTTPAPARHSYESFFSALVSWWRHPGAHREWVLVGWEPAEREGARHQVLQTKMASPGGPSSSRGWSAAALDPLPPSPTDLHLPQRGHHPGGDGGRRGRGHAA